MVTNSNKKHALEIHLCFMVKTLYHKCEVYATERSRKE